MCTVYSCTVHVYTVSGLALPVTLLCSARHHPGPGGTPGQCHWYNFVWECTGHWSGPVCFKAADRIGIGSCPEMEEGCGATGGDNFHFTAAAWTFYQHLLSLLLLWPSARGVRRWWGQWEARDGAHWPMRGQDTSQPSYWPLILLP